MQLRFASSAMIDLREGFHLQECAYAGRTKKNPEPVRFGIEAPIIAMGRAREEGTNSGYEMALLKTKNKSQNTPHSVKNDSIFLGCL
jgi:hypothetical protein